MAHRPLTTSAGSWGGPREPTPLFLAFKRCRSGATAIEYALIAALVAVVLMGSINVAGSSLKGTMERVGDAMAAALGSGAPGGGPTGPDKGKPNRPDHGNGPGGGNNGNGKGNGGPKDG